MSPSPYLAMAVGLCAVSTAAIFIRLALDEVDPLAVAAWRLAIASVVMIPLTALRGFTFPADRTLRILTVAAGAALSVHFMTWVSSLDLTTVAASTTLVATYPLMVALAAPVLLGEQPGRLTVLAGLLGLFGVLLIAVDDGNPLTGEVGGNVLALAGAAAAAVYFTLGRRVRPRFELLPFLSLVYGTAALILVPIALVFAGDLFPSSAAGLLWLLLLGLVPQLIGHSSFNYALGQLPATFVTIVILGEPLLSTALAVIVLDEVPGVWLFLGMPVLLAAVAIASFEEQRRRKLEQRGSRGALEGDADTVVTVSP
ncbi:MAG TPA: DMT family transporter [Dehalococcoidia bacterium]|nr:DMT family transporter [Dehalococcoidia bacterium]